MFKSIGSRLGAPFVVVSSLLAAVTFFGGANELVEAFLLPMREPQSLPASARPAKEALARRRSPTALPGNDAAFRDF